MKELHAEIDIAAPAAIVWEILSRLEDYEAWNPFIREAVGVLTVGERLTLRIEPPGGRGMTFRPRVLVVEPGRELRWIGRLGMRGVFDGEHSFELEPVAADRVRFSQHERFRGVLAGPLLRRFGAATLMGFRNMNDALKVRAEARARSEP
jgi:hypothetical protein